MRKAKWAGALLLGLLFLLLHLPLLLQLSQGFIAILHGLVGGRVIGGAFGGGGVGGGLLAFDEEAGRLGAGDHDSHRLQQVVDELRQVPRGLKQPADELGAPGAGLLRLLRGTL